MQRHAHSENQMVLSWLLLQVFFEGTRGDGDADGK